MSFHKFIFQELYIAQEKSLTEELRKKDERIAELEREKVNNDNETFSDSDDDDFHTNIRELDAINDKFYEVNLGVSGYRSRCFILFRISSF